MGYHWLLLNDGTLVIGTKDDPMGRSSWATLMSNGTMRAVSDHELLDTKPVKKVQAAMEENTYAVGEII